MAKLRNIIETTAVPTKPQTPTVPTKPKPKPDIKPWNPPRPKEDPAPKARGVETPTKPRPSTEPSPTKPRPKPDIKPWNPPRPKEDPAPKARAKAFFLREAYEDEVDPSTRRFWGGIRQSDHSFAKHPILAMYGEESAKKAYQDNVERLMKAFPELQNVPERRRLSAAAQRATQLFMQMGRMESNYRPELEQIAKDVVSEVYGLPQEAMIAKLGADARQNWQEQQQQQVNRKPKPIGFEEEDALEVEGKRPEDLQSQINKRITMNLLTQGAAIHNMMSIYHLATEKINSLDPRLLRAYQKLAPGMVSTYWLMDFMAMADYLGDNIQGSARVIYADEDESTDDDDFSKLFDDDSAEESEEEFGAEPDQDNVEYDGPKVKAIGANFPILIQELVKGVMEILSHHGLADLDPDTTSKVLQAADVLTDEPWLIQVGPHIWRSFLQIVPKGSDLAMIVAKLATKDPKFIHDLLSQTIEAIHSGGDATAQRQALQDMIDDIEDYTGEDIDELY